MKRILCFGDSNTWGLIPGTRSRFPWGVRWTSLLAETLAPRGVQILEEGLCGRTTVFDDAFRPCRRGTELLPALLETHAPLDGVILMLGTNDCKTLYHASAGVIALGMEQLLQQIASLLPGCPVLVISPILLGEGVGEPGFDPEFDERSVAVSHGLKPALQAAAARNGAAFLAASDCASPSPVDREHLTEAGHRQLAGAILETLEALGW